MLSGFPTFSLVACQTIVFYDFDSVKTQSKGVGSERKCCKGNFLTVPQLSEMLKCVLC